MDPLWQELLDKLPVTSDVAFGILPPILGVFHCPVRIYPEARPAIPFKSPEHSTSIKVKDLAR